MTTLESTNPNPHFSLFSLCTISCFFNSGSCRVMSRSLEPRWVRVGQGRNWVVQLGRRRCVGKDPVVSLASLDWVLLGERRGGGRWCTVEQMGLLRLELKELGLLRWVDEDDDEREGSLLTSAIANWSQRERETGFQCQMFCIWGLEAVL